MLKGADGVCVQCTLRTCTHSSAVAVRTLQMVFVAHPRDANDRVLWLLEVGRFEEALGAAEAGLRAARGLTNGDIAQVGRRKPGKRKGRMVVCSLAMVTGRHGAVLEGAVCEVAFLFAPSATAHQASMSVGSCSM